jgi:hypothetical protein
MLSLLVGNARDFTAGEFGSNLRAVPNRFAIFVVCFLLFLVGPAATAQADTATQLPFTNQNGAWVVVDPVGQHVFVSGGPGTSSIVVLNYAGAIVKTITGQNGASGMALDPTTHTLYSALHDVTEISEINTQTLTETHRFATQFADPTSVAIAGGKLWYSCYQNDGQGCLVQANLDGSGQTSPISGFFFATTLAAGGPSNKYLAIGETYESPPMIKVYDVSGSSPILISSARPDDGDVASMTFDPSGANLLLATGAPYYIQSLATSTLLPSGQYPTGPYPIAVAVTSDGKFVAGGINSNTGKNVFVYPVGSTTPVRSELVGDSPGGGLLSHSLAFTPNASELFAVAQDSATGHLAFHVIDKPTIALKATATSMSGSARTVHYGSHATLTVHMSGTTSGKIDLFATNGSATNKLVATAAVKSGTATFTVTPTQNTTYSAQFEEGSGYAASTSQSVSIAVAPGLSVVTHPHGKARLRGHRVSVTLLTAHVRPARPNEPLGFVVQRRVRRRWRTAASNQFTMQSGTVHAFFFTNKPGQCRVRVLYAGDTNYAGSKSTWKKFRVRPLR